MNTTNDNKDADTRLSGPEIRHEKFVEGFLANGGNATKAAQFAGYDQSPASLRAHASRLLKRPDINSRIKARMLAGARVQTDEILGELANRMRSNLGDVLDEQGQVDLAALQALDLGHLIRRITIVTKKAPSGGGAPGEPPEEVQSVRLELQSHPEAVSHLARVLRAGHSGNSDQDFDRFIQKVREALIDFDAQIDESEPGLGLTPEQVFERFVKAEPSKDWGFNVRRHKNDIMEDLNIGWPSPQQDTSGGA
jgi:hypothetical protein